jgi:hypothetical protein
MSFMAEPSGNPTIGRVLLDGSVIAVPPEHRESFATLLAHLELLALRSRRVLTSLNVDGVAVRLDCPPDWQSRWDEVEGHSISFAELSSRLISSAAVNLTQLRKGVEKTVLLVMINDPRCLERTWSSWNPDVGNTLAVTVLLLTALGCTSIHESDYVNGPDYVPANVYEIQLLLESRYRCDAVLFAHLTEYHPYPPIRMGWNLKLVQATNSAVLWSVDEIFDASRQEVVNSARRYYKGHEWGIRTVGNSRAILDSPRRFAMYTLHRK